MRIEEQKQQQPTPEEFAAARRADYARALKEEREGLERAGKKDRVAAVDAELKRLAAEAKSADAKKTEREG